MRTLFAIVVVGCRNEIKTPTIVDDTAGLVLMILMVMGFMRMRIVMIRFLNLSQCT